MKKLTREFILKTVKDNSQVAVKVTDATIAQEYARAFYGDDMLIFESAFIILLNRANNTIGWAKISQGGISATVVDVKIICKFAIDALASGVIFVHNHPSGNLAPSIPDINLVKNIEMALKTLDIKLLDSIILTETDFYSFKDNGRL